MPFQQRQGAVIYAKALDRLVAFYVNAIGFQVVEQADEYVVIDHAGIQLVILQAPAQIADAISISDPPAPREETPIKLVFFAELDTVRTRAPESGGGLMPSEREWRFQDTRVCDGFDPEGNIFQIRQPV